MDSEPLGGLLYTQIIGFIVSLMVCALFSFLETSITALRLFKLKELAKSTQRYRPLLTTLEKSPHQILITILIANSIANVSASALITSIVEEFFAYFHFSSGVGFSFGVGIATCLILIFGEVLPKNIAKLYGERLFQSTLWITNIAFYILYPFVRVLLKASDYIFKGFGGTQESRELITSEKEIRFLIDYIQEKGLIEAEKTAMLHSIFNLSRIQVKEIMIPITDVVMINLNSSLKDALSMYVRFHYSRLPIYDEHRENIVGMLHQKDVFAHVINESNVSIKEVIRPILFIPESMKLYQLLRQLRDERLHIAMIINEYGSTTGLVTLEDVLEEIVGDIRDEYEPVTQKIIERPEGGWIVDGTIDLNGLNAVLGIVLEAENAVTLGGFLTEQLQHVPRQGERILYKNYYFQVQNASPKRVLTVLITKDILQEPALPKSEIL